MSAIAQESFDLIHRLVLALLFEANFSSGIKNELIQCLKWRSATTEPLSALVSNVSDRSWDRAEREIQDAHERGVAIISVFDPLYPRKLLQVYDPPALLFVRGQMPVMEMNHEIKRTVAIVGTRRATPYGLRNAFRLAGDITRAGALVSSGLALGIDTAAHEGAIDAIGNSQDHQTRSPDRKNSAGVAVLGSGVMNIYPAENTKLAQALIEAGGCVLSEYGLKTIPMAHFFPERNRIISGISDAVVVVEAPTKSGAMITARLALEEGREVLAVPGPADSPSSAGPHELIRNGAGIMTSIEDLLNLSQWYAPRLQSGAGLKKPASLIRQVMTSKGKLSAPVKRLGAIERVEASNEFSSEQKLMAQSVIRFLETRGTADFEQLVAGISQNLNCSPTVLSSLISQLEVAGIVQTGTGSTIVLSD